MSTIDPPVAVSDVVVRFAPAGSTTFAEGTTITKAAGDATSIKVPSAAGTDKLYVVSAQGARSPESAPLLH